MDKTGPPPPYGMQSAPLLQQDGTAFPTVSYAVQQVQQGRVLTNVGPESTIGICPSCNASISTRIKMKSTTRTHVIALVMCLFCCIPCCLIPYCMDSCRNINHYCPSCGAYIGSYHN